MKGKRKTQKNAENQIEDDLAEGNYFTELQMKIGSLLYALFFASVVAAVMKRSRVAIVILTLVYGSVLWYLRR